VEHIMGVESYVLTVSEVIQETADAKSIAFEVPDELRDEFAYTPGQFLTIAVPSDRDGIASRCYSLSSAPHSGRHQITVKRTADGYASNWLNDNVRPGDTLRLLPPSGIFTPKQIDDDLLLFAGGSGVTPVMSILTTALETGTGQVVLFYANRDEESVIFAARLRELAEQYADRLLVVHWLESVQGLPTVGQLRAFSARFADYTAFVCGPAPFMAAVVGVLKELGFPRARRHQEKFVTLGGNPFGEIEDARAAEETLAEVDDPVDDAGDSAGDPAGDSAVGTSAGPGTVAGPVAVEVELDGDNYSFDDWMGVKPLLEFLEDKGVKAPFSCREGECSACACVVLEGDVVLRHNDVLDADDLADGIRLACQSFPASEKLRISYSA
jgi:3-ketosteroid 9alpha-monooxygenase subunit B